MNDALQKGLTTLENLILTQENCVDCDDPNSRDYMHGMLNGMILAHSVFDNSPAKFYTITRRKNRRAVRHKSLVIRKGGRR